MATTYESVSDLAEALRRAEEAHGAFVAQSSGWYRWHWNNPTGSPITIHLKLRGYYEPAAMPPVGMPYDR